MDDHRARASAGNEPGKVHARGVGKSRALWAEAHQARRADAERPSPLPAGRWLLAVTRVFGTAMPISGGDRPTVPTIISP